MKNSFKFLHIFHINNEVSKIYRPLINDAIEEDFQEPKDLSHLDYKYLKSYEGPLAKSPIKEEDLDLENEKLLN